MISELDSKDRGLESRPLRFRVTPLGKLFALDTPLPPGRLSNRLIESVVAVILELCTSGFTDDVILALNWPYGATSTRCSK